jgi:methionine aminopeptidase
MKAGNTFTIEPMISEGTWRDEKWVKENEFFFYSILDNFLIVLINLLFYLKPDDWTVVTAGECLPK